MQRVWDIELSAKTIAGLEQMGMPPVVNGDEEAEKRATAWLGGFMAGAAAEFFARKAERDAK